MAVMPVWRALAFLVISILVKGEAPFSANEASEAASLLKDSREEQALEEAALTEAALMDPEGKKPAEVTTQATRKVPPRPHLRAARPKAASPKAHPVSTPVAADETAQESPAPEQPVKVLDAAAPAAIPSTSDMEKMVTDMMLGKSAFGATPFGKSVSQITDLIEKDMMPKVMAAHTANQLELDQLMKQVHECAKTKNIGVGKANKKKALYLKMSPLHKTCRAGEAGKRTEKTECLQELKDKKGLMLLKCKEFAFIEKKVGDQNSNRQIVKKAGNEATEQYVRRITATVCGKYPPGGKGGGGQGGMLDRFMIAKEACEKAERDYTVQFKKCTRTTKEYNGKRASCDNLQDLMDGAACKRAVQMKDACETYAECYYDKKKVYLATEKMVKVEEKDRQAEWRGLKRMQCLMSSFSDGKVKASEVETCKKKVHDVGHLVVKYPPLPKLVSCTVPDRYPSTAPYKLAEFAPLPALAKGKADANECTGVIEIPTKPAKGSPKTCKCERVTLNGPYSPGPLVKCSNCWDIRRSQDLNSCPFGTKLFSPRSAADWKTVLSSVGELQAPNFIVDITRPQNGCGGCTGKPMNSAEKAQGRFWHTADGSPWWLRSKTFKEPSANYHANCYMAVVKPFEDEGDLRFDANQCKFHAKSYYCQLKYVSTTPKRGSPTACKCESVALTGIYSAGALLKCTGCLRVSKSTQRNSCPIGTKIFSPTGPRDWKTFLASAGPLRSPHWIVDVTRPQNGCGGCTKFAMNSKNPAQMTWRTSDGSPWWLRSTRYSEPNGDYYANCYLDLWKTPANENSVTFNDGRCNYHSNAYFCQPAKKR